MTFFRLIAAFALAIGLTAAAPAFAGGQGPYGDATRGLPLDPQLLPANTAPGDCVTRRMTGPGGAYRWDRVECGADQGYAERGWSDHDQWGYGRAPQVVETRGASPASYACDRCSAPVPPPPGYCDPCSGAAPSAYYDRRVADYSRAQVQGYQSGYQGGYQAHFQGGYDTVCIQGCVPQGYAQQGYAQGYAYARGYAGAEGDRYGPAPAYAYNTDYAVSGRDEAGYLVWPGKRP
jgi:hypothetical protein